MGRRAKPGFELRSRGGWAWIHFHYAGKTVREAVGVPFDPQRSGPEETRRAREAAAKHFADFHAGRARELTARVRTTATLAELGAAWLDAIETPANAKTCRTRSTYVRHWIVFASDPTRWAKDTRSPVERLTSDEGPEDYMMARLRASLRKTVRKELSSLFAFFQWCKTRGFLASLPPRPAIPKGEPGVRTGKQRAKPVDVTPEEARSIVDAMPEWSRVLPLEPERRAKNIRQRGLPFRVRDVFDLMWETGLRPSTIARLDVPRSWTPGSPELVLHDEDDKVRYGRSVRLSARAQAVLARVAPEEGLIFGTHDYRAFVKAAALVVLPKPKALAFARYDFRHGRANAWLATTGNMLGVAYQLGHKQLTTTNLYLRPSQRHGDAVVLTAAERGGEADSCTIDVRETDETDESAENSSGREDSNLRPLDPQQGGESASHTKTAGSSSDGDGPQRQNSPANAGSGRDSRTFDARALTDAQRALTVQEEVWRAFDAWEFLTLDDLYEDERGAP